MSYRNYSSTAKATTLTASAGSAATTITVNEATGYPPTPFTLAINRERPNLAELVEVTAVSGTTLTVTRGVDGTTPKEHGVGASVVHTFSARDFREMQESVGAGNFARRFLFGGHT